MFSQEERCLAGFSERCPVAADDAVVGNHRLEDAAVVVGFVPEIGRQNDVAAFITDEIFIVGWYQEILSFAESPCAAIVGKVECPSFPFFSVNGMPH